MNKAALRRFALEIRLELGVGPYGPFDPYLLASLYGIDIHLLTHADSSEQVQNHFKTHGVRAFSGALIPVGNGAVILDNDHHDLRRRRATVAHEMAHVVREHRFSSTLVSEDGCRTANRTQEEEATELAAELLLPAEAAKALAARDASNAEVADLHQVSLKLAGWRLNATGARIIAARSAAKRR